MPACEGIPSNRTILIREDKLKPAALRRAADFLAELTTRLPYWGWVLLAFAVYTLLHPIAILQFPTPTGMVDLISTVLGELLVMLARIGENLLPLGFLVAAVVSGFDRWKRSDLRASVARDTSGSFLRGLPPTDFELLVGDAFRRRAYRVRPLPSGSQPYGRTFALLKDGRRFLLDYSDWMSRKAGAAAVRKLNEHMKELGAAGGFAVTSGQFTPEARHFAAEKDIELLDGRQLKELIRTEPQPIRDDSSFDVRELRAVFARWRELISATHLPWRGKTHGRGPGGVDDAEKAVRQRLMAPARFKSRLAIEFERFGRRACRRSDSLRLQHWTAPRIRTRTIIDAFGVLAAIGLLWGVCTWFVELPDAAQGMPWALLGTGGESGKWVEQLNGMVRDRSPSGLLVGMRPLGQFNFGPPPSLSIPAQPESPDREEPVEVYHSLRELETAFDAKYVAPPECYAIQSDLLFVKCGNHRIRARRTFIDNGGKVTATLLGGWEEPRAIRTTPQREDWRQYDEDDWPQGYAQDWNQQDPRYGDLDVRQERGQPLEPNRDWYPADTREPVSTSREHEPEPTAQWNRRPEDGQDPQSDWSRASPEHIAPKPYREWSHQWPHAPIADSDGYRQREWVQWPARNPTQDLQQDWPRPVEDKWSPEVESQPLPVERWHWVDAP
jgi:restriction system protein